MGRNRWVTSPEWLSTSGLPLRLPVAACCLSEGQIFLQVPSSTGPPLCLLVTYFSFSSFSLPSFLFSLARYQVTEAGLKLTTWLRLNLEFLILLAVLVKSWVPSTHHHAGFMWCSPLNSGLRDTRQELCPWICLISLVLSVTGATKHETETC